MPKASNRTAELLGRTARQFTRRRVLYQSGLLEPGRYRWHGSVLVRIGETPPSWLSDTKYSTTPLRLRSQVHLRPARSRSEATDSARGCIVLEKSSQWLIFAPGVSVTRRLSRPIDAIRYRELRAAMAPFIDSPSFTVSCDGRSIVEEWVDGFPLRTLDPDEAVGRLQGLVRGYRRLVEASRACGDAGEAEGYVATMLKVAARSALDVELQAYLQGRSFRRAVSMGPVTASHGEAGGHNVRAVGPHTVLIDWEPKHLGLRPFWCDVVMLVSSVAGRTGSFGQLRDEIRLLLSSAGAVDDELFSDAEMTAAAAAFAHLCRRTTLIRTEAGGSETVGLGPFGPNARGAVLGIPQSAIRLANSSWRRRPPNGV